MASFGVGIAAVVVTMALGDGAKIVVIEQILALGTNAIFINPGSPIVQGVRQPRERSPALTVADGMALREAVSLLKWTCWTAGEDVHVVHGHDNWTTRVVGITPSCLDIRNWEFVEGGPFFEDDLARYNAVAIIGQTVAKQLFGPETNPMAARIRLSKVAPSHAGIVGAMDGRFQRGVGCAENGLSARPPFMDWFAQAGLSKPLACGVGAAPWSCSGGNARAPYESFRRAGVYEGDKSTGPSACMTPAWEFEVVGVLAPKGMNSFGIDLDDVVYVPFSTTLQKVKGRGLADSVEAILASTESREEVAPAIEQIRAVLRERHGLEAGEADDFTIKTDAEMSGVSHSADADLVKMLVAIAAVSLIGAGIGIMNILLVSVTERTREIGVRMAVGAKRRHILMQFLIEAVTLSLVGGCVGIVFGMLGARITTVIAGWPTIISGQTVAAAFLFSAAVGLFFGLYPANKAARLNPIDALRYE
jgi:ABC-type antimicrobial peptide transport system permease subunit